MNQEDKLKVLIQEAIENGFKPPLNNVQVPNQDTWPHDPGEILAYYGGVWEKILYNHDFMKAAFSEDLIPLYEFYHGERGGIYDRVVAWMWLLQQAILEDNPIDYLYNTLVSDFWYTILKENNKCKKK